MDAILGLGDSVEDGKVINATDSNQGSVFHRLTPMDDLQYGGVRILQREKSFADAVGNQSSNGLKYFPMKDRNDSSVLFPVELAKEASKAFRTTIFGFFLGPRVPFPIVQRVVNTAWGKFGISDVMMNSNGIFFFKFNDEGGSVQAIEEGMLMIRGVPLFVFPWDPSKGIHKPAHDTCPLWVKLHNIPLVAFNREGVSRIASALGVPKQMDACTTSMCDKNWGRPGFAKVLVEAWATGHLKKEVELIIPHLTDDGVDKVMIRVEYLWEPLQCKHCCVFGHKTTTCIKSVRKENASQKKPQVDSDGFVSVQKKQWRRKLTTDVLHHGPNVATSSGVKEVHVMPNVSDMPKEDVASDPPLVDVVGEDIMGQEAQIMEEGEHRVVNDGPSGGSGETAPIAESFGVAPSRPLMDSVVNAFKARRAIPPTPPMLQTNNRFKALGKDVAHNTGKLTKEVAERRDKGVKGVVIRG